MTVRSTIAEESVRRAGTARSALDLQRRNCAEVSGPTILLYFLCGCLSCFLCGCLFVIFPLWLFICHVSFVAVCHVCGCLSYFLWGCLSCFCCGCAFVVFPLWLFACDVSFVAVCLSCFLCGCLNFVDGGDTTWGWWTGRTTMATPAVGSQHWSAGGCGGRSRLHCTCQTTLKIQVKTSRLYPPVLSSSSYSHFTS